MKTIVVRDRRTGRPVQIPVSFIPEAIRPDNWFENPYWRYRPDGEDLEPLIQALFADAPLELEQIKKLAQYILDYACHIATAAYIFGGGRESVEYNSEAVARLRALARMATTKEHIREMIRVGMEYALDPF